MVDFTPSSGRSPIVLWKDDGTFKDSRRKVVGNYFTVYNLTQLDNGRFSMKDRNRLVLSSTDLEVVGKLAVQLVLPSSLSFLVLCMFCTFWTTSPLFCFGLLCFFFCFVFLILLFMLICRNSLHSL